MVGEVHRFVFGRITVERRGKDVWAVLDGETCLGRGRDRAFEPSPSARDEAFLARFRFPLKDAVEIATIASQKP